MERSTLFLHVEDDPVDVANLRRAFSRRGIRNPIHAVPNGERALALLRGELAHAIGRPGIILLDLGMPVMGGLEFLAQIKKDGRLRSIPVVVLTGSNRDEERRSAYELGAAGYVVKPMDFDDFAEAITIIERYWALCQSP